MVRDNAPPGHGNSLGPILLLPCNGHSARGRLATRVAKLLSEQMGDELDLLMPIPLAAGVSDARERFDRARYVIGVAGCEQQCDVAVCTSATGFGPDESVMIGDLIRANVCAYDDLTTEELAELPLQISSRVLAKISEVD